MKLDREELSTKFDEANQTIGALRFENNFLIEKTKKLEAELFQVRAQLERTSSAKLDESNDNHILPNCYKWLATQQSNDMIASGNQNQLQSSLTALGDLLKALIFLSNLNGFNSSPLLPIQGFNQRKGSSKVWKEKGLQVILSLSSLSLCFCFCITCVFCFYFESV